jgi:hypothetical protein
METYKGIFRPLNPGKYKGDHTKIVYRSRWELVFMMKIDKDKDVIEWSSEEVIVPYRSPIDGRMHRYFPDFVVKKKDKDGKVKVAMIEIKPKKQTVEPKRQKKPTKRYVTEVQTWGVNSAKWEAAQEYCADRMWQFLIYTEDELGIPKWSQSRSFKR